MSEVQIWGSKYISARKNVLIVMAFTVVNILLMVLNVDMYFLFSATMPQVFYVLGAILSEEAKSPIFLIIGIVLAVVVIGLYALGFFLSKKNFNWMTFLAVFFALDIAFLVYYIYLYGGFAVIADFLLDILFHIFVMISLVSGVINASKLKKAGISVKDVFSPDFLKVPVETVRSNITNVQQSKDTIPEENESYENTDENTIAVVEDATNDKVD